MDIQKNELFKSGVKKLSAAMAQIKFNDSLTVEDAEKIRGHIYEARSSISALADVNQDPNGQFSSLIKMADFLDKALYVATNDHCL